MYRVTALVACLLFTTGVPAQARLRDIHTSWDKLSAQFQGKPITIVLPDGSQVKGRVKSVDADKLVIEHRHGPTAVPRASVKTFTTKRSGYIGKVIGTAVGLGAGIALGVFVNEYAHNEGDGAPGVVALIVAIPAAIGFWAGYAVDRKTVTVVVD